MIMVANFLFGKVLIIDTGYYAQRLKTIALTHKSLFKYVKKNHFNNHCDRTRPIGVRL